MKIWKAKTNEEEGQLRALLPFSSFAFELDLAHFEDGVLHSDLITSRGWRADYSFMRRREEREKVEGEGRAFEVERGER